MIIKVTYISEDDEEFDSAEECLEHERVMQTEGKALFFDSDRQPIEGTVINKFEGAFYIYILDGEKAKSLFKWAEDYIGCPVPDECETSALYFFDERKQCYEDLGKKIEELVSIGESIMKEVEKAKREGNGC